MKVTISETSRIIAKIEEDVKICNDNIYAALKQSMEAQQTMRDWIIRRERLEAMAAHFAIIASEDLSSFG